MGQTHPPWVGPLVSTLLFFLRDLSVKTPDPQDLLKNPEDLLENRGDPDQSSLSIVTND